MLETNRLLIRNFVAEDTHSCFEGWGKDKKLGKYIFGYPAEEKQMEAFGSETIRKGGRIVVLDGDGNSLDNMDNSFLSNFDALEA